MLIKYSVIHYFLVEKVNASLQRDPRNTTADLVIFWLVEKRNSLWDSVWTSHTSMKPGCCVLWDCCLLTSCLITAQLWSSVPACGSCSDSWESSRQWTHSEGVWKGIATVCWLRIVEHTACWCSYKHIEMKGRELERVEELQNSPWICLYQNML